MKKSDAIKLFGGSGSLHRALGISRQALWAWPEELDRRRTLLVLGAALERDIAVYRDLLGVESR